MASFVRFIRSERLPVMLSLIRTRAVIASQIYNMYSFATLWGGSETSCNYPVPNLLPDCTEKAERICLREMKHV